MLQFCECTLCCDEIAYKILGDSAIETDEERAQKHKDNTIVFLGENCSIQPYSKKVKLEYYGFCTWMLAQGKGILIPGIPNIGIAVYKNVNYAFSAPEVALMFEDNPEKCMYKIIETARNKIELVRLLGIYDQMKEFLYETQTTSFCEGSGELSKQTCDQEVQTELHPIPYHKDEKYMWNIWDIRRKAIQLANLRKCYTTSAQTMMSYQKYNVNLQTNTAAKMAGCQTNIESFTNTRKCNHSKDDDLSACLEVTKLQ